jgi:hypothetical protein
MKQFIIKDYKIKYPNEDFEEFEKELENETFKRL